MKVARILLPALVLVAAVAACRTTPAPHQAMAGPRGAVLGFLEGVRKENARTVSDHWGTSEGPARARMSESELEQRLYVMMRCLRHDSARVSSERAGDANRRVVHVDLYRSGALRQTAFIAVPSRGNRWLVEQIDMEPVRDICAAR